MIHLFCVCACLCGSVGGYRCQAARFLLISTYSRNANNNSILTHSLEVTVLSECSPGLLCVRNRKQNPACGELLALLRSIEWKWSCNAHFFKIVFTPNMSSAVQNSVWSVRPHYLSVLGSHGFPGGTFGSCAASQHKIHWRTGKTVRPSDLKKHTHFWGVSHWSSCPACHSCSVSL